MCKFTIFFVNGKPRDNRARPTAPNIPQKSPFLPLRAGICVAVVYIHYLRIKNSRFLYQFVCEIKNYV